MNRDAAAVAVVALLAILALSAAAATLDSTVEGSGGGGSGVGLTVTPDGGGDTREVPEGKTPEPGTDTGSRPEICFPVLNRPPVIAMLIGLWVVLVGWAWRAYYAELALTVGAFAGIWGGLVHQFVADCGPLPSGPPVPNLERKPPETPTPVPETPAAVGNGSAGGAAQFAEPSLSMGLLVLGLLVVGVLVVYRMSGDAELPEADEPPGEGDEADVSAIGSVAGQAADRIEDEASLENEVFRAWREMTTYLDVDRPGASTPGEFAGAAVAAGMAERDVAELTRLFEEVRYGDRPADEDRTERAVAALRRIEREYADAEPDLTAEAAGDDEDSGGAPERDGTGVEEPTDDGSGEGEP